MKWVKDPDGNPEMFGDQPGYPEATEIGSNFEVGMVRTPDLCERLVLRPIEARFCKEDNMLPVFFFLGGSNTRENQIFMISWNTTPLLKSADLFLGGWVLNIPT